MIFLKKVDYTLHHAGQRLEILQRVCLSIPPGQIVGLVGSSGSGKSTLLSLIAGIENPTAGQIRINGIDFSVLSPDGLARFRRDHLGMVFQDFHLIPALTALENVALPLELAGRVREATKEAQSMLSQVGLAHRTEHRPSELSGGEQQRVAIARAFAGRPPLILADEPTGNLDQDTSHRIMNLLFSLVGQWHATMLLVTHDPVLAQKATRRIRLDNGILREAA